MSIAQRVNPLGATRYADNPLTNTLLHTLLTNLQQAGQHNANVMSRPEVILWPDPDRQWEAVLPIIQQNRPGLISLGDYDPAQQRGPAIYLKCLVARTLPAANWPAETVPVIYLPGVSKADLKQAATTSSPLQPLVEYQYSGVVWTQENGREWTVMAFMSNAQTGLGLRVAQDAATRETLLRALPMLFEEDRLSYDRPLIDADFLHERLFPDAIPALLRWLSEGDAGLAALSAEQRTLFGAVCRSRYGFEPDYRNIHDIMVKFGSQRNAWRGVWQYYANAPHKHPALPERLRSAKPDDLGVGLLALPDESWPQVNEAQESELRTALRKLIDKTPAEARTKLQSLAGQHRPRLSWVWAELGQAPLAAAVEHLSNLAALATAPFPAGSVDELKNYYVTTGHQTDRAMRYAVSAARTQADAAVVQALVRTIYQPWLETITRKFQGLIASDATVFTGQWAATETAPYVLFVDALRYELAAELVERLTRSGYRTDLRTGWSALPSLTPTAKPAVSPVAGVIAPDSEFSEFRPSLSTGQTLLPAAFRGELQRQGYQYVSDLSTVNPTGRYWQEIGDIDTKGHQEGTGLVRRVDELFAQLLETIALIFERGVTRIKMVTDHGWLLLPGGLPKELMPKELTETRWGRCALLKEGAHTDLLQLPWRWNPGVFIAYAPGIAFFKANEPYAHGGVSVHECLIPTLFIENREQPMVKVSFRAVKWNGLRCVVETDGAPDGYQVDIRTKFADPATSILLVAPPSLKAGKVSLPTDDRYEGQAATLVLTDPVGVILDKQLTTVGG